MGSCHTIPALLTTDHILLERCMICWESIPENATNYAKCANCRTRFHSSCANQYKQNYISDPLSCPHCKRVGVLYLYDNDMYDCKKM